MPASIPHLLPTLAATILLCGLCHAGSQAADPPEFPEEATTNLPPAAFPFTVRPALHFLSPDRAELTWHSSTPGRSLVNFGPTEDLGRKVVSKTGGTRHRVIFDQLLPNTSYQYKIITRTSNGTATSKLYTFDTTLNEVPPIYQK